MYRPITGAPFLNNSSYREVLPCEALRSYIRCFWGTEKSAPNRAEKPSPRIVIPDTCMDIIFDIDSSKSRLSGSFCAIDDRSYDIGGAEKRAFSETFGIRFYAWTAVLFSERDFTGQKNRAFDIGEFSGRLKAELEPLLLRYPTMGERIAAAEAVLLKALCTDRINSDLLNAVYYMLKTEGRAKISDIASYASLSERQLERVFSYNTGVSPKILCSLMRYQLLWQDMVMSPRFDILDAVEKYGYADQSHLLNDFRRRHMMTPREAVEYAAKTR